MDSRNTKHPLYQTWRDMIKRCYYEDHPAYEYYGARDINVCQRWLRFRNFIFDMGNRPEGYTLDRIDPNGDYELNNCRWATNSLQSFNQNISKNNTSGKTGVSWEADRCRWVARISVDGKLKTLGRFHSFEDAVRVREKAELKFYGFIKE